MEMLITLSLFYLSCDLCLGDPSYAAEWSDVIRSCPDFDNTYYSFDNLELGSSPSSDDEDVGLSLRGNLLFLQDMIDGYTMDLEIFKCTEIGDEPMYSVKGDFCASLKNTDTPWYPVVAKFNSSSCPIPQDVYSMDGVRASIEFAKDVITHEFCGEYKARLAIMDNMDMLSCHILSLAVVEKYGEK